MPKKDFRKGGTVIHRPSGKKYMFLGFSDNDEASLYQKDDGLVKVLLKELEENYYAMAVSQRQSRERRSGQMW